MEERWCLVWVAVVLGLFGVGCREEVPPRTPTPVILERQFTQVTTRPDDTLAVAGYSLARIRGLADSLRTISRYGDNHYMDSVAVMLLAICSSEEKISQDFKRGFNFYIGHIGLERRAMIWKTNMPPGSCDRSERCEKLCAKLNYVRKGKILE